MADTYVDNARRSDTTDSAVGWVIAAIIVLALIVGLFAIFRNTNTAGNTAPAAGVQTQIPNTGVDNGVPSTGGTGASGGATTQ